MFSSLPVCVAALPLPSPPWLQFLTTFLYRLFPKCCLSPSATRLSSTSLTYHHPRAASPTTSILICPEGPPCSSSTATRTFWPRPVLSTSSTLLLGRIDQLLAFPPSTTSSA